MKTDSKISTGHGSGENYCFARSVLNALQKDRSLEAVTIDRQKHTISLATLGQADVAGLSARIAADFEAAESADATNTCLLLNGNADCAQCDTPLTAEERTRVNIRTDGPSTTIARVT